ncbi:unnamed protein product [Caenorhabditis sp. 36 PRJEB53466]|nr:unnamed protein product [Caenorhabditis sp. 36 PRJEB53466]
MDDKHIGSVISADTADGSVYQGKLTTLDKNSGNVTMANVIKDGLPLNCCVTLSVREIESLRVIRGPAPSVSSSAPSFSSSVRGDPLKLQKPLKKPEKVQNSASISPKQAIVVPPKCKGKSPKKSNVEKLFEHHMNLLSSPSRQSSFRSKKHGRQSPEKNGFTHVTEEISATPLFKNFERQVPNPQVLSAILPNTGGGGGRCSRKQGPSGNPVLDALNHYKGIGRKNKTDLAEPIDFDLESDFDFAENLKLFEKDEEDDEYYENVEKLKVSHNFAHYENIIEDENRITSWTNLKARGQEGAGKVEKKSNFQVTAISFEKTMNGDPIPAISVNEKKEFLQECKNSLGEAVFDALFADRVFQWTSEIQTSFGDPHGTIVVLASAANSVRSVRRLLTHFDKRRYNCHLFGKYPGEQFEYVNVVDEVKQLPREAPIICILSQEVNEDVESWLRAQSHGLPRFVCVESVPVYLDASRCHLLQFGCATNGLRHVERKIKAVNKGEITFEKLCQGRVHEETTTCIVDSAIADLGSPAYWFDDLSSKFIATAFATTLLVRLSLS